MNYIKDQTQYTLAQIRRDNPNVSIPNGEPDLAHLGYYPLEATARPAIEPYQSLASGIEEYEPGKWRETWTVNTPSLDELKTRRKAELAAMRYEKEVAGITVGGTPVATDPVSQAKLTGAWSTAQINPAVLIDWKGADGSWTQLYAATIAVLAAAVSAHVQACFSHERALFETLDAAETVEALYAIDMNTGWPE